MVQHYTFKHPDLPPVDKIGGKGLSLIHLARRGFNVPPAVVLSTEFFRPWLRELKATPEWRAFAQAQGDGLAAAATALKGTCRSLTFTGDQQRTLNQVREYLRAERAGLMAVRSSSPQEDLEGASFAGIYETVLGVTGGTLEVAIRTCFASALDGRVAAYKQERGYDPLEPQIAVIIQKQIASEVAGVAFSLNPLSNCYDECVINANYGLGQTVVDGAVTPDQAIVDKVRGAILEKTHGRKESAVYLKAGGGTESRELDPLPRFCLSDNQLLAITSLAARVEAEYGRPVDIEWAYDGGQLYLLQARPITTYYRLPNEMITEPGRQKHLYHDANLTEQGLPENMSTLGEETFIRTTSSLMGADPGIATLERGIAFGCAGRTYTNVGRMVKLTGKKNLIGTIRIVDEYGTEILETMDLSEYIPKRLPKGLLLAFARTALLGVNVILPMLRAGRNPEGYLAYYRSEIESFKSKVRSAFAEDTPFAEFYRFALLEVGRHVFFVGVPPLMATQRARRRLKKAFKNEPELVQEHLWFVEQAFPHNVTMEMGLTLYELSQSPDVQQTDTAQEFVDRLSAGRLAPEFMAQWQHFMDNYGFRCPKEADVATPRYYEKPGEVFTLLKTMGSYDDPGATPLGIYERAAQRRVESFRFLEEYLAEKSPRKVRAFRKNYKILESFAAYRESPKYLMILAIDLIRRRALALAEQWVAAGRLDSASQVFDLEEKDISRAEADPDYDIRALAEANRAYIAQFNPHADPPVLIDSRGWIPRLPPKPRQSNELLGTPVSHGIARGPVKVLRRADEKPLLPGEILVTKATDPGWTTLFLNASGVLLESGGTLQHGASVARESGKPCIVAIDRVTRILRDGQMVEMDGATGVVRIVD